MVKGIFITLEGPDGSGKTTQAKKLVKYLRSRKFAVVYTREPGGTPVAERIRQLLLLPRLKMEKEAELLLYLAARVENVEKVIKPALKKSKIVICERFTLSTVAYQGFGRRLDFNLIKELNNFVTAGLKPDLTILLDIPPRQGLKRATATKKKRIGIKGDRLEQEEGNFHQRVRRGFLALAHRHPAAIKIIKVNKSIAKIHQQIREITDKFLRGKRAI